jgi:hypothetical protein
VNIAAIIAKAKNKMIIALKVLNLDFPPFWKILKI